MRIPLVVAFADQTKLKSRNSVPSQQVAFSARDFRADYTEVALREGLGERGTRHAPIRVLVIDREPIVRAALGALLGTAEDMDVIGITGPEVTLEDFDELLPDVVVFSAGGGAAASGASPMNGLRTDVPLVVIAPEETHHLLGEAVANGAHAFVVRTQAGADLLGAVRAAAAGSQLIPAGTLAELIRWRRQREAARRSLNGGDALTAREQEVLQLLCEGLDNREIAERLDVSYTTVRAHVHHVLGKLSVRTRLEAVARQYARNPETDSYPDLIG
jgi:DNA-binding NarL/FixJ family response regulator